MKGNYSHINKSNFTNHESERGTVYIEGNNFNCTDSMLINNTASYGGAGLYMDGDDSYVNNTLFRNNNATVYGGAIYTQGSHIHIFNSNFTSNNAIPNPANIDQGLGGAIYIMGDNNTIAYSYFDLNTARNGSAVYNRGDNLSFEDDVFEENQAWSYLLLTTADPELSYYSETNTVKVEIIHIGGDNIINAVHNDGSPEKVFFYNVTYDHSTGKKTTTPDEINPRDGVENSENGKWLYQDPREDLQIVNVDIVHKETGEVVYRDIGSKTGLYGNITAYLVGLNPGNYTVNAEHPEDLLYKEISNSTKFEILPVADLAIVKEVSNKNPNLGDTITWTLKVTNNGPNDATGVYVTDEIPAGLIYVGSDGNYDVNTHIWTIGDLAVGNTVVLNIRTIVNISNTNILNVATVNSSTYDPNKTNNNASNDTEALVPGFDVQKITITPLVMVGNQAIFEIVVKNTGNATLNNVFVEESSYDGLIFDHAHIKVIGFKVL